MLGIKRTSSLGVFLWLLASAGSVSAQGDFDHLEAQLSEVFEQYGVATAGAALIRGGKLVWTGYFGEQRPGVPASRTTLFNVGSVAKTVTAETAVRLADQGIISFDEAMADHWVDPDLAEDPRHLQLTPRMALSHSTGLPNWRYMDPEFKLRFKHDPGTTYEYSGEGIEYLAQYLQRKTGEGFASLVRSEVVASLENKALSVSVEPWVLEAAARPVDASGERRTPFCTGPDARRCTRDGGWSAADDLATTVEAYAELMIGVMTGESVKPDLQKERFRIQTSTKNNPVLKCALKDQGRCPRAQGYGLGWEMFEFEDSIIASHGGADWSERAMVYFDVESKDGIILFLNAPSDPSIDALIAGMRLLDPGSRLAELYQGWVDAYRGLQEAAAAE